MRVVPQDPEQLKQSIESTNESIKKEQDAVAFWERKLNEITGKGEITKNTYEDVALCAKNMEEVENEIRKCDNLEQSTRELGQSIESKTFEQASLKAEKDRLKRQETTNMEKIDRFFEQKKSKLQEMENKWHESEEEYKKLKDEQREIETKKYAEKTSIEAIENKMHAMRDTSEKNRIETQKEYGNFKNQTVYRLQEILQLIENEELFTREMQ